MHVKYGTTRRRDVIAYRIYIVYYTTICYTLCYAKYAMLYAVLCYAILCSAMLCYAMLCYAMLWYAMLCYDMLCYAMLCYAMLCYAMLCYTILCYAMLSWYYVILRCAALFVKNIFNMIAEEYVQLMFNW